LETSFLADFHPKVVHFPVALLVTYSFLELFGVIFNKEFITKSALLILCIGVISAFVAVLSGNSAASEFNLWSDESKALLDQHQTFATYLLWFAIIGCALRIYLAVKKKFIGFGKYIFILFAVVLILLVYKTGLHGGELVKKYGVGTDFIN